MKKFLISIIVFLVLLIVGICLLCFGVATYLGMAFVYISIIDLIASVIFSILALFNKVDKLNALIKNYENNQYESEKVSNLNLNEAVVEAPPKPTWEELSKEEQQPYIKDAIKFLYENQLKEEELTRQQKAFKEMCLKDNEFLYDDLTDDEKSQVDRLAKIGFETEQESINNGCFKLAFSKIGMSINENNIRIKTPSRTINERSVEERFTECEEEKIRFRATCGK